jgi:hypothetical protein
MPSSKFIVPVFENMFANLGSTVEELKKRLVAVCVDGASVNMGIINWLQALIKKKMTP